MPALNFQSQWADAVEAGAILANGFKLDWVPYPLRGCCPKRTTMRRVRSDIRPGVTLHLFTGQRTKACRKIAEVLCLSVTPIGVLEDRVRLGDGPLIWTRGEDWERLARQDTAGLWSGDELRAYLRKTYGLPFHGVLIGW